MVMFAITKKDLLTIIMLRYCEKATKLGNKSSTSFDVYSVTSKQLGDFYKIFGLFQEIWLLKNNCLEWKISLCSVLLRYFQAWVPIVPMQCFPPGDSMLMMMRDPSDYFTICLTGSLTDWLSWLQRSTFRSYSAYANSFDFPCLGLFIYCISNKKERVLYGCFDKKKVMKCT